MTDKIADARVRDQYEAYPYPARDPRDEAKRLITGSPSDIRTSTRQKGQRSAMRTKPS